MATTTAPARDEAAEYYFTYINHVGPGDIRDILDAQLPETLALLEEISEEQSLHRYAPEKWSIRQVLGHMNDTERLFAFRALWFARGLEDALPSFDQDAAVAEAASDERPWRDHIDEFRAVRTASSALFRGLRDDVWLRRGRASGFEFTVRALAYITAGHVSHHVKILQERYL